MGRGTRAWLSVFVPWRHRILGVLINFLYYVPINRLLSQGIPNIVIKVLGS
jgi:hypothetical protein